VSNGHLETVRCVLKKEQIVAPLNVGIFSVGTVSLGGEEKSPNAHYADSPCRWTDFFQYIISEHYDLYNP